MKLQLSTFQTKKLGELAEIGRGSSPRPIQDQKYFVGGKIPWIKIADATASGKYLYETKQYVNDYGASFSRRLKPGSLILAASGVSLGQVQILGVEGCVHDGWLYFSNLKNIDLNYLYYALQWIRQHFFNMSSGAAIQNINTDILRNTEIPYPDITIQNSIGKILSAYDNLIENNNRRISILEEMAQSLYLEWFVKFRFPGCENTKFIDSPLGKIPEGWKLSTLGAHLKELESGKRPKGGIVDIETGVPSVGAENINGIGRHKYSSEKLVPQEFFDDMRKGVVKERDVAIYKDGAYIGRSTYFRDNFPHEEFCVNEHVFLLRTDNELITQNFLYLWLQHSETVANIRATNANAAQPGINQQGISGLKLLLPSKNIISEFDKLIDPLLGGIIVNAKRSRNLQKQRDLLLPKLIKGSIGLI